MIVFGPNFMVITDIFGQNPPFSLSLSFQGSSIVAAVVRTNPLATCTNTETISINISQVEIVFDKNRVEKRESTVENIYAGLNMPSGESLVLQRLGGLSGGM